MSTERPEFRPIEAAPARHVWLYALMGAVIAGLLIFIARRNLAASAPAKEVAFASVAPSGDPKPLKIEPLLAPAGEASAAAKKAPESPNVIGSAVAAAGKLAMVARSELDRELGHSRVAREQTAAYKKQIDSLQRELTEARAQIAAYQKARQPPPPSDQEQILQMLAPVLRTANDGRP
jgi:hypothetical protein